MTKLALATLLLMACSQAIAHEGHGVAVDSAIHYLTGTHLLALIGLGLCAAAACYVTLGRRQGLLNRVTRHFNGR